MAGLESDTIGGFNSMLQKQKALNGEENSSREFSAEKVKAMIEHEKERYGWEFVFLGANIDVMETAAHFGISADRAVDYVPDKAGTALNFQMMSEAVASFRETSAIPAAPFAAIRQDMKKRGKLFRNKK